jgi:hypothetical protein
LAIELPEQQGHIYLSTEEQETERKNLTEVVLCGSLKVAIYKLNPDILFHD